MGVAPPIPPPRRCAPPPQSSDFVRVASIHFSSASCHRALASSRLLTAMFAFCRAVHHMRAALTTTMAHSKSRIENRINRTRQQPRRIFYHPAEFTSIFVTARPHSRINGNDTTGNDTTGNNTTGNDTAGSDTAGRSQLATPGNCWSMIFRGYSCESGDASWQETGTYERSSFRT